MGVAVSGGGAAGALNTDVQIINNLPVIIGGKPYVGANDILWALNNQETGMMDPLKAAQQTLNIWQMMSTDAGQKDDLWGKMTIHFLIWENQNNLIWT